MRLKGFHNLQLELGELGLGHLSTTPVCVSTTLVCYSQELSTGGEGLTENREET